MDISEIANISPATPATSVTQSMDTLGKDAFLQLLVTQLKYQDPTNPIDSAQSLLQTAQFTMVEKLDVIAAAVTGQQQFGQLAAAGSIVGKQATWVDTLGNQHTGLIRSAFVDADGVILDVDGTKVPVEAVVNYSVASDATAFSFATNPIPSAPADIENLSRSDILTGSEPVYMPYDGPRKFSVPSVLDADGQLSPETPFYDLFVAAGERWGVPPEILAAMTKTESAFNLDAVSPDNAQGMLQFLPSTAEWMNVDPSNPASAIDGAARYIRAELDKFGDMSLAVAAYNAGSGAVERYGDIPPYEETQNYVVKVFEYAGWSR